MHFVRNKYCRLFFPAIIILIIFSGCSKLIEIDPPINDIVGETVYSVPYSATGIFTGIFAEMSASSFATGTKGLSVELGQYADELIPTRELTEFYTNNLQSTENYHWSELYRYIFRCNSAIEGISKSPLKDIVKRQLIGEAKFTRSFCYFYLTNLFGDVPLLTTTDYHVNGEAPRADTSVIYDFIINDLKEARDLLNENYVSALDITTATTDRARPNKATATALLARAYLYTHQWQNAEDEATAIISNTANYALLPLADVFKHVPGQHNKEGIWQLQPVDRYGEVPDGRAFMPGNSAPFYILSDYIYEAFEVNDNRKTIWTNTESVDLESGNPITVDPYPMKYLSSLRLGVNPSEYLMVFRVAEQYLIRAEARAQQGKLEAGKGDLNAIRLRAGLSENTATSKSELLDAIINERRNEFFSEWGHRWFDLKRTGRANAILSVHKADGWQETDQLFPIPTSEIDKNKSLQGQQNPGY